MDWSFVYYELTGSTEKANEVIARYQGTDDPTGFLARCTCGVALVDRNCDRAEQAIEKSPVSIFDAYGGARATKKFFLGTVALARGETAKARKLFEAELPFARSEVSEAPDSALGHAQLGLILAYLGRTEEAVAEGEHAVALLPITKDTQEGPNILVVLAEIYARVGKPEEAVALLEKLITIPSGWRQVYLKEWNWDPLRSDPRFQKLVDGPPPKIVYH
jgi:tetratricopeptide (TPR) repeat protein